MKTRIPIDKDLLTQLLRWTNADSPSEAVEQALSGWMRRQKVKKLKALRGRLELAGEIAELRGLELEECAAPPQGTTAASGAKT